MQKSVLYSEMSKLEKRLHKSQDKYVGRISDNQEWVVIDTFYHPENDKICPIIRRFDTGEVFKLFTPCYNCFHLKGRTLQSKRQSLIEHYVGLIVDGRTITDFVSNGKRFYPVLKENNIQYTYQGSVQSLLKTRRTIDRHKYTNNRNKLVVQTIRKTAQKLGIEFSLSGNKTEALLDGNCDYCGSPSVTIIRKNSSEGFTDSNSIGCCSICEGIRQTMNEEEMAKWLDKIEV